MATIESYIRQFFFVGSRTRVQTRQREILGKLVSWESQTLTAPQQEQARANIGLNSVFKNGVRVFLTKGTHNVAFTVPFTGNYIILPYGSTGTSSFAPIITDVSHLDYFTVKMPVDGYLSWQGCLTTET